MPELPEVETVRRGLARARLSGRVVSVWRSRHRLRTGTHWQRNRERVRTMAGFEPGPVLRRGKHLLWTGRRPGQDVTWALLIHLGMSGRVEVVRAGEPRARHTHWSATLDDGRQVRFVDPRRFGGLRFAALPRLLASPPLCDLGPEPVDERFDGAMLAARVGRTRRTVRAALLDQSVVAGVGNIYALEGTFLAGVDPRSRCHRVRPSAWDRIALALRRVLLEAIADGGTTSRDFRNADGHEGRHQQSLWVYGRGGAPCRRCGAEIAAYTFEGRGSASCPTCQPRGRGGWVR